MTIGEAVKVLRSMEAYTARQQEAIDIAVQAMERYSKMRRQIDEQNARISQLIASSHE